MKKYGRTFHLPISPGATSDDKIMLSLEGLMVEDLVHGRCTIGGGDSSQQGKRARIDEACPAVDP